MSKRASTDPTNQPSREDAAFQALHQLQAGIEDISDLCQFLIDNGPLGESDFPRGVAAAISMIHVRALSLQSVLGEVL